MIRTPPDVIGSVFSLFVAVILAAQAPVHLELNSEAGVYSKGETVEVEHPDNADFVCYDLEISMLRVTQ